MVDCVSLVRAAVHLVRPRPLAIHPVHRVKAVHHATVKLPAKIVCKKVMGGLLAGGLALMPPASGTGRDPATGVGGFPRGVVSEYGSPAGSNGSGAGSGVPNSSYGGIGTGGSSPFATGPFATGLQVSAVASTAATSSIFASAFSTVAAPELARGLGTPSFPERMDTPIPPTVTVPEPSTWILLGTGIAVAALWRARRRSRDRIQVTTR